MFPGYVSRPCLLSVGPYGIITFCLLMFPCEVKSYGQAGSLRWREMIALTIKDRAALHNCYMPFIRHGGLFVANHTEHALGDEVSILLDLMDEPEKIPVVGKVVWVAGKGVKSPHTPGIGVQFSDADGIAKDKIETLLAGAPESAQATATM